MACEIWSKISWSTCAMRRGQAEQTQKTYAALLGNFVTWAEKQRAYGLEGRSSFRHLMDFSGSTSATRQLKDAAG